MPDAVGASGEALTTFRTLIRLLTSVDPLVCSQVRGIGEGFATLNTYKGLLLCLRLWMSNRVLWSFSGDNDFLPWLF